MSLIASCTVVMMPDRVSRSHVSTVHRLTSGQAVTRQQRPPAGIRSVLHFGGGGGGLAVAVFTRLWCRAVAGRRPMSMSMLVVGTYRDVDASRKTQKAKNRPIPDHLAIIENHVRRAGVLSSGACAVFANANLTANPSRSGHWPLRGPNMGRSGVKRHSCKTPQMSSLFSANSM